MDVAKITEPGIYVDFDVAAYFADPAPVPSFSQSIGKILIEQSPAHAAVAHPRLHLPDTDDEESEKYVKAQVIGDAAHSLMIGRGKNLAIADFADWKKGEAKEFKKNAEAAGKTPILAKHLAVAERIVAAGRAQLDAHDESTCFTKGQGEVALIWKEGTIWFRCLVDWLHNDLRTVDDFKTSGMSVAEHVLGKRAADGGWDIQAAMIERGLAVLDPNNAGRRRYRFIAQEQDDPHALNVMVMNEYWLTMGRKKLQRAVDLWTRSISTGHWPAYPPVSITPEYPGFKENQWMARETGEFDRPEPVRKVAAVSDDHMMGG